VNSTFEDLVRRRAGHLRDFLEWANDRELNARSLRTRARPDIAEAREVLAADWFGEPWWALVVYSCFSSLVGTELAAKEFPEPIPLRSAQHRIRRLEDLPPRSVGHHRIQPGHTGARLALLSACEHSTNFHDVLMADTSFDARYQELRLLHALQWGRTTCFDLLLRAGELAVSGKRYQPKFAYLADSSGPRAGFKLIWGFEIAAKTAAWSEEVLRLWAADWAHVADAVSGCWSTSAGGPYSVADLENALCIYQEEPSRQVCA
jgi:hypothetical protein